MTFYTMDLAERPVVLCERCALRATNWAFRDNPFNSMKEAALMMNTLMATVGDQTEITASDSGTCESCERTTDGNDHRLNHDQR